MKIFFLTLLLTITPWTFAGNSAVGSSSMDGRSIILQLKYSPWGGIDADEDEFEGLAPADDDYSKYDMTFEQSYSARIIVEPFYISLQQSTTDLDSDIPDAEVTTFSAGFAGITYDAFESNNNIYLLGALGVGQGTFKFKNPALDADELLLEANGEIGFHINKRLLIGAGIDYQHFGEFRESIASSWTFYFTTGLVF